MLTDVRPARHLVLVAFAIIANCAKPQPAPSLLSFAGLPVRGSLADARAAGFTNCVELPPGLRCRRDGVMIQGQGPYSASVDLVRRDGSGGFTELTLWHDLDQNAVFAIGEAFEDLGWNACLTGEGNRGDYKIWTLKGAPVRLSMDISYWSKRRFRVIPEKAVPDRAC